MFRLSEYMSCKISKLKLLFDYILLLDDGPSGEHSALKQITQEHNYHWEVWSCQERFKLIKEYSKI